MIWVAAVGSGVLTLAVEVAWTRLFAQVLHNSVYTYAIVLSVFLTALALGALVAHQLCRIRRLPPTAVLAAILALSAFATLMSPALFDAVAGILHERSAGMGWHGYVGVVILAAVVAMLPPGIVIGSVLPWLMRLLEADPRRPGALIGRLVAGNTLGAVAGALGAGFVLLPILGTATTLIALGIGYGMLAVLITLALGARPGLRTATAGAVLLSVSLPVVVGLVPVTDVADRPNERLVDHREGSQATVEVVDRDGDLSIRVNNHYLLGGTRARHSERNQAVVALLGHPSPRSVFFLGLGTGITAGGAMPFDVERVVVCELIRDVVELAQEHFGPWTSGLFEDPRVEIHAEDGRICLRRSPERYDVIVADLFTPWKAGTGNLYTKEHFEIARDRLHPGGRFVQWIPLYQVSDRELGSIARTMTEVFDQVTLWRGDLFSTTSIVALVGEDAEATLDAEAMIRIARTLPRHHLYDDDELEALVLRAYVGNVTASGVFEGSPVNTERRPFVELEAPRTHREARAGRVNLMIGAQREHLYDRLMEVVDRGGDPYVAGLTDRQLDLVRAGRVASRYAWLRRSGSDDQVRATWDALVALTPGVEDRFGMPSRLLLG